MSHEHNGAHHHHDRPRPSIRALFNNFRTYDAPFHEKLALAFRNTLIKIQTRSDCCGHPGQPGC
jgi:hypothetical protein